MKLVFAAVLLTLSVCQITRAAEIPVLAATPEPFSFVVLGDLHYTRPEFATQKVVASIAASIRNFQPPVAFVCQTGDIAEGGTYEVRNGKRAFRQANFDEMKEELSFAVKDATEQFGLPLFMAVGNHDQHAGGKAFSEVVPPLLSRELGAEVRDSCYGFRRGNACFVFLDFSPADLDGQRDRARDFLSSARKAGIRHLFLFAHYPLWPLIRPGFSSQRFTDSILPLFREFPVDAFFCGHTHNTSVSVRQTGGAVVTQIQGVACQASRKLVPMEERRTLLIPREELSYYWGYQSGPPGGYFLTTVDGERVRVQFRSGATVLREFEWREPGRMVDLKMPASGSSTPVSEEDLRQAQAAAVVFCPWAEDPVKTGIWLNGQRITTAQVGPVMRAESFARETRISIPEESLKLLRRDNEVKLENPGSALFAVGHLQLEVTLASGSVIRSEVSNRFFFSGDESDGKKAGNDSGWRMIPPEARKAARPGELLGPIPLRFPSGPSASQ